MGTVQITSTGFAALPGTPPKNWPTNIVWPGGATFNGSKSYTISDADAQQIFSWIATTYNAQLVGTNPPPVSVPALQIFVAWLNGFMQATTNSVQQQQITPAVTTPPISIS